MEMSSALTADVCQWGGRIEARSTHLPPQGEDCDEVDEEIICALREQPHYDTLLAERARFQPSHLYKVVRTLPNICEELAPGDGGGGRVGLDIRILEETNDFAVGIGLGDMEDVLRQGHRW